MPEIPLATLSFQVKAEDHLAVSTLWSKMNELLAGPPEDFDTFVRCEPAHRSVTCWTHQQFALCCVWLLSA